MWSRALVALAVAAVLCGAPSSASAAGRNWLIAPQASPTSGTIATTFSFTVAYVGGFPALSATVDVAGRTLPMLLVNGTPTDGAWSVSTLLPNGSWSPVFQAVASHGKDPSVTGPAVTVGPPSTSPSPSTGPASTDPGAPATSAQPKAGAAGGGPGGSDSPGSPASPAAPAPTPSGGSSSESLEPPPTNVTPLAPVPVPSVAGAHAPVPSDGTTVNQSPGTGILTSAPDAAAPPALAPQHANATPAVGTATIPTENAFGALEIAVGLGGAAALVLFGWFILLAGRRRRTTAEPSRVGDEVGTPGGTADEQVTATLYRRTLRRSRIRLDDDPIGIGEPDPEPPIHRARRPTRRSPPT